MFFHYITILPILKQEDYHYVQRSTAKSRLLAGGGTADDSAAEAWERIQYRIHDRRNAFPVLSGQRTFFPGLFALLSRKGDKMDPQAKLGCILSIIGLCLGIAIFIYAAVTVYQNFPELIQQYQQLYEMYQGGM